MVALNGFEIFARNSRGGGGLWFLADMVPRVAEKYGISLNLVISPMGPGRWG